MHGTGVTISLVPNQGFRVKKWINVDSFSGLTGRINMNADHIVQINLERTSVSAQSTPRPTFAVATRTPKPTSTPRPTPLAHIDAETGSNADCGPSNRDRLSRDSTTNSQVECCASWLSWFEKMYSYRLYSRAKAATCFIQTALHVVSFTRSMPVLVGR